MFLGRERFAVQPERCQSVPGKQTSFHRRRAYVECKNGCNHAALYHGATGQGKPEKDQYILKTERT